MTFVPFGVPDSYQVIVIGGGHAGAEAAWAAANLLPCDTAGGESRPTVALVTLDPATIGVMSCNPAIGGLAKGQLVREIDALGGLMGLATDATGIQFKVLNTSRGAAVHGPRAQCDKHAYAEAVRSLIAARPEIDVIAGSVERLVVERGRITGVVVAGRAGSRALGARAVVLTTGTFMRGLMHTGERKTEGGRHGEGSAVGISAALREFGFELGRLKTGTPPRLAKSTIDWDGLERQRGDEEPVPFSDLTPTAAADEGWAVGGLALDRFPRLEQAECRVTSTSEPVHEVIRANLHRAPMYSGQIESVGPRYCPSIEDKVVRFAERSGHTVFLEPESHRDEWVYCNGISTSLPADVQDQIVRALPGCGRARVLRYGYAVEYDMVRPHQILPTGMTRRVEGLFLAGQINGTSGYEEAAAQGIIAGINAAHLALGRREFTLGRHEAYIGVLMDDLVCKTPVEPYRMFTSRAEHRLLLRADNAADRLTPIAERLGLLDTAPLGRRRRDVFARRGRDLARAGAFVESAAVGGVPLGHQMRRPEFGVADLRRAVSVDPASRIDPIAAPVWATIHAEHKYAAYIERQRAEVRRHAELEHRTIPGTMEFGTIESLRPEARQALDRFRPRTFGQAGRLEGITPADLTLLAVLIKRHRRGDGGAPAREPAAAL